MNTFFIFASVFCGLQSSTELKSPDPARQVDAIQKLMATADDMSVDSIRELVVLLDDSTFEVKLTALQALKTVAHRSEPAANAIVASLGDRLLSLEAEKCLISLGASVKRPVINALQSGKDLPRTALYSVLESMGPRARDGIPAIESGLAEKDLLTRVYAAKAIVAIDPSSKVIKSVLIAALEDPSLQLRITSAIALSRSIHFRREVKGHLLNLLFQKDANINDRMQIAVAISRLGNEANDVIPKLTEAFRSVEIVAQQFVIAGAIVMIDPVHKEAVEFLENNSEYLDQLVRPSSDAIFQEFALRLRDRREGERK